MSDILFFLILSLAVQGLILAGILFYSSKKIPANRWLATFILTIAQSTLVSLGMTAGFFMKHLWLIPLTPLIRMAIGPLLYFYVRSVVNGNKKLSAKDYLHFLPLLLDSKYQVIYILLHTGILSIPFVQEFFFDPATQHFLFDPSPLDNVPILLSIIIYSIASYKIVSASSRDQNLSPYKGSDIKWIKILLQMGFAVILIFIVSISFRIMDGRSNYYILHIAITVCMYWLGMSAYVRQGKMQPNDIIEYNAPVSKVFFSDNEAIGHQEKLKLVMDTEQVYLDPTIKLISLAEKLGISENALSNLLNQHIGKNFNDFVNEYRIEAAKKKLADPTLSRFTIAAISYDCGFNSLATFQRCFKQFTGTTPSQYQKTVNGTAK